MSDDNLSLDGLLPPEDEVRLWRRYFAQCRIVYGEKKGGTLKELLKRVAIHGVNFLDQVPLHLAIHRALEEYENESAEPLAKARKSIEQERGKKYFPQYNRAAVVFTYLAMIDPVDARMPEEYRIDKNCKPMDKLEAIERTAERFGFPSACACYKFLQRQEIKDLPSTWPKAGTDQVPPEK